MSPASFDFVIAGAGTSGLVLAARLSERADVTVALLEAGDLVEQDPRVAVPGMWHALLGDEQLDWKIESVAQDGLNGRKLMLSGGRLVGGSSAINSAVFAPIARKALDFWASAGNEGWSHAALLPYYRRFHTRHDGAPAAASSFQSDSSDASETSVPAAGQTVGDGKGPIQATLISPIDDELPQLWTRSFDQAGLQCTSDPYLGAGVGAFRNPVTVTPDTKTRSSALSAYYPLLKDRENVTVMTCVVVQKVLFERTDGSVTATGLEYLARDGSVAQINADKEVILCAGALQSPKLLEVSGVGSRDLLEKHNIEVLVDNPFVGENLQDHPMTGISFEAADGVATLDSMLRQEPDAVGQALSDYTERQSGPLTSGGIDLFSLLPLPASDRSACAALIDAPPLKPPIPHPSTGLFTDYVRSLLSSPSEPLATANCTRVQHSFDTGHDGSHTAHSVVAGLKPGKYLSLVMSLMYPLSRGSTHLQSADASVPPVTDPGYLSHPLDAAALSRALARAAQIVRAGPLSAMLKDGGKQTIPQATLDDPDKLVSWVRGGTISYWHYCGTCAMLPRDKGGVVDERLRVYGASRLRVVDASVIPLIAAGNLQTTVYTVAERGADVIREDYGLLA